MLGLFLFAALNMLAASGQLDDREEDIRREQYGYYENSYVTDAGVQMICDSMRESLAVAVARDNFLKMYGGFGLMTRNAPMLHRNGCNIFTSEFAVQWLMLAGYVQRRAEGVRLMELMIEKGLIRRCGNGEYTFTGKRLQEPPPAYEAPAPSSRLAITQSARAENIDSTTNIAASTTSTSNTNSTVTYTPISAEEMEAAGQGGSRSNPSAADDEVPPPYDEALASAGNAAVAQTGATVAETLPAAPAVEQSETVAQPEAATPRTESSPASAAARSQQGQAQTQRERRPLSQQQQQQQQRRRANEDDGRSFGNWFSTLIDSLAQEFTSSPYDSSPRQNQTQNSTPARRNTTASVRQTRAQQQPPRAAQSIADIVADTARAERAENSLATAAAVADVAAPALGARRATAPALRPPSYEEIALSAPGSTDAAPGVVGANVEVSAGADAVALPPPPPYIPS